MKDLIDITKPHLNDIAEYKNRKRKPKNAEVAENEDIVKHTMYEYYAKLYAQYPDLSRQQHIVQVADRFNKTVDEIENLYVRFRWFARARQDYKTKDTSGIPKESSDIMTEMISNAGLISKLGTRLVSDFMTNANPDLLTAKDIFKLGMLVVECIRVTNELRGGSSAGQLQGQVINLVINE